MPLFNLTELRARLGRDQRLIGLDPGAKTIGVALTDVRLTLASPYGSLRRGKLRDNAAQVLAISRQEGAGGLVVGLPLSMDGTVGPAAQAARGLDPGDVPGNRAAGGIMGRAPIDRCRQPLLDRRGRSQSAKTGSCGGPGSGCLDAASRPGRQQVMRRPFPDAVLPG